MKNQNVKYLALSSFLVILIITGVYFLTKVEMNGKVSIEEFNLESSVVSTDPKISASNFIKANGTMGDISTMNQEAINNGLTETNSDRRQASFDKVKDAIVPGSPLLSNKIGEVIANDNVEFYTFYEVQNVKASEPSELYKTAVYDEESGEVVYDSVDVYVDFSSYQHTFYWPTDADGQNIITQKRFSEDFENVKVTLIKSGDSWFIYDVEDSEYLLNKRMATWHGKGKPTEPDETLILNEFVIERKVDAY